MDNAIKFAPEMGRVSVRVETRDPETATLEVEDDGPGIEPQDLPHIFERFYRADRVRTPGASGAGLGLALAQSIAQSHGSAVQVRTEVGRGSVFRVDFHATDKYAPSAAHALPSTAIAGQNLKTS